MSWILIADDRRSTCEGLALALKAKGHSTQIALDGEVAIEMARHRFFDLAIVDIRMPKRNGIEVLEAVKATSPETIVIMMTAFGTIDIAVEAMQKGAADFITKPYTLEQIKLKVDKALQQTRVSMENQYPRKELEIRYNLDNIIGESPKMQQIYAKVQMVAATNSTVLIVGESGTGKELIARAIHQHSQRKERAFVRVYCEALEEGILERELLGYEKGAFTDAVRQKPGRLELANEGTLFLDEVGDLPLSTQVKLLRVLQEREFERVGGTKAISVDVRLIAASNRDLPSLIRARRFREDLYYRLNVVPFEIPPLRERREDIPLLVAHFLRKYSAKTGKRISDIHPDVMVMLSAYSWPGNVRELENAIERAIVLADSDTILLKHLLVSSGMGISQNNHRNIPTTGSLAQQMNAFEKGLILEALEKNEWVRSKAAAALDIPRPTLNYKMAKHNISPPEEYES